MQQRLLLLYADHDLHISENFLFAFPILVHIFLYLLIFLLHWVYSVQQHASWNAAPH
jgi:hypothetical protein